MEEHKDKEKSKLKEIERVGGDGGEERQRQGGVEEDDAVDALCQALVPNIQRWSNCPSSWSVYYVYVCMCVGGCVYRISVSILLIV